MNNVYSYNINNDIDLKKLIDNYFCPSLIEGCLQCDQCKKDGISKILKYIFKLPEIILISFLDFTSIIKKGNENSIKFKPFQKLIFNSFLFCKYKGQNSNDCISTNKNNFFFINLKLLKAEIFFKYYYM